MSAAADAPLPESPEKDELNTAFIADEAEDSDDAEDTSSVATDEVELDYFDEDGFETYEKVCEKINQNKILNLISKVLTKQEFSKLIKGEIRTKVKDFLNPFSEYGHMPSFAKRDVLNYNLHYLAKDLDSLCDKILAKKVQDVELSKQYFSLVAKIEAIKNIFYSI